MNRFNCPRARALIFPSARASASRAGLAWLVAACAAAGCIGGGSSADGGASPAAAVATLVDCGLFGEGEVRNVNQVPLALMDPCYLRCLAEASCEDLNAFVCSWEAQGDLDTCQVDCTLRDAFTCPSGAVVARNAVCDGVDNCVGGEDEEDCEDVPSDDCRVDGFSRCDGYEDCPDGRDEEDCEYHECDGQKTSLNYVCDGWEWCDDGSDEVGCAERTCGN